jgi:FtsP/CotA-like multicopper oxidase with cupredoxin domain
MATATTERDPRHHTQKMQKRLQEIRDHLREDIEKVDEPQLEIDFIANDAGPSLLHCHHQDHQDEGFMGLVTYL